jgi:lariat debranching enzyme
MISNEGHPRSLTVAVQGCCHGELDTIYSTILEAEARDGVHVDLLLICGDFEGVRVEGDLDSMAVPDKYKHMNSFRAYLLGEKVAPELPVVVGGNHEASNVLQPLYYGCFVAPNIYYMGASGVVLMGSDGLVMGDDGMEDASTMLVGGVDGVVSDDDRVEEAAVAARVRAQIIGGEMEAGFH